MIEQHLKNLAEEFQFPFDHLNKVLTVNLSPPFSVEYRDHKLKFLGLMPKISDDKKEDLFLQFMQLNLALESVESFSIGLAADNKPSLNAEFNYNLNYKEIKNRIESFANHLDKISSMIQDLNKQR